MNNQLTHSIEQFSTAETYIQFYEWIFYICIIGIICFLGVTIFLYRKNHIRKIIGELTGMRRNREILQMRKKKLEESEKLPLYPLKQRDIPVEVTARLDRASEKTTLLEEKQEYMLQENILLSDSGEWIK